MNLETNSTNIPVINLLRGLAALSVCFFHFVFSTIDYISNDTVLDVFYYGKKGVQVFFIISGIVIPLSMIKINYTYKKMGSFILKRFVRIEPPYLFAVALGISFLFLRNFISGTVEVDLTPRFSDVLLHIGYLVPFFEDAKWVNPVFWTLSVEFQYYIFLAVTFPLVLTGKLFGRMFFYSIILGIPFLVSSSAFFVSWSAFFSLGIFYSLFIMNKIMIREYFLASFIALIVVFLNQGATDAFIGGGTLLIIFYFKNYSTRMGEWLGKISYSLYLLHSIVGASFINYLSHIYRTPFQQVLVVLGGVLVSIVSAYLFWLFIERPSQKLAKEIKIK